MDVPARKTVHTQLDAIFSTYVSAHKVDAFANIRTAARHGSRTEYAEIFRSLYEKVYELTWPDIDILGVRERK